MTNQVQEQQADRKDLKIQALLEKISSMTAAYENQLADARVEITVLSNHIESMVKENPGEVQEIPDATADNEN